MARVFLAQFESDGGFSRWVAVKVIHPHLAKDRRFVDMLLDEACVTSQIHHPNVCSILDFGEKEGEPHIVMEYIHGLAFSSIIKFGWPGGKLPFWLSAKIVADAARGLHAAHEQRDGAGKPVGIVHRDVSPQNIMVHYDGVSKILDFGIARARGRIVQTGSYEVKGKFTYMAPEQLEGRPIDRRADIWALSVILWEATVGKHLFRGKNDGQTTLNVISKEIPKPSDLVPGYPPELEKVVMQGLRRDLDERTQTAADFADALDAYLWTLSLRTGPTQVSRWMRNAFANQRNRREQFMHTLIPGRNKTNAEQDYDKFEEMRTEAASWVEESGARPSSEHEIAPLSPPLVEPIDETETALEVLGGAPDSMAVESGKSSNKWLWLAAIALAVIGAGLWFLVGAQEDPGLRSSVPNPKAAIVEDKPKQEVEVAGDLETPTSTQENAAVSDEQKAGDSEPTQKNLAASDMQKADAIGEGDETQRKAAALSDEKAEPEVDPLETAKPVVKKREPKRVVRPKGTGSLNLLAIPAGEVYLGSKRLGRTPLPNYKLPVGTHRLRLKRNGQTKRITVRIKANRTTKMVIPPDS